MQHTCTNIITWRFWTIFVYFGNLFKLPQFFLTTTTCGLRFREIHWNLGSHGNLGKFISAEVTESLEISTCIFCNKALIVALFNHRDHRNSHSLVKREDANQQQFIIPFSRGFLWNIHKFWQLLNTLFYYIVWFQSTLKLMTINIIIVSLHFMFQSSIPIYNFYSSVV